MTAASKGPRYAPEDPTLPKPWRELIDGSTGNHYYWNPETSVTQYERPVVESLPPPPPGPPPAVRSRSRGDDARHAPSRGHQSSRSTARVHAASDGGSGLSAEAYRRQHEISVTGDEVPAPFTSFESAGFPSEILKEVHHAGFSSPTPIQAQSWPIAMKGYDVVAIAKTGSGKTLGYLIPAFIHIKSRRNNPRMGPTVLVLAPTRELATQIQDEAEKFGRTSRIASTCLYGGAPKGPQLRDLDRGVDVIVATPGRLNDILEMRRVSLRQVSYLVLDEADRMLDMGFEPQIMKIVKEIPQRRQTLMFTATWPREVKKIAADLLAHPIQVNIGGTDELVANKAITQFVEVITATGKQRRLEQILQSQDPDSKVIIFCSTKRMCDQLARTLDRRFGAAAIHGDKSQGERDRVLNQFRTGRSPILVATDVASRGLDIKDIRVVVNYDFPTDIEDYVHRIGRTGRAGATGVSYTFFSDKDSRYAPDLIKVLEGSKQKVPLELRDLVKHGRRGGGRNGKRRWRSISGRDGGRSNSRRDDSSYGGRGGYGLLPYGGADSRHGPRGYSDDELDDRYARGHELDKRDSKGALTSTDRRTRGRSPSRSRSRSRSRSWTSNRSRSFSPTPKRRRVEHVNSRSRSRDNSQSGRSPSRSVSPGLDRGAGSAYRHSPSRRPEPAREHNKASHPVRSPLPSSSQQSQQQKSPPYDDDYEDTKDAEQNRSPSPWKEKSGSPFHGVVNGKQGESTSPVKSNRNISPEYHGDDVVEAGGKQPVTEAQNVANIGEEGTISQSVGSPKKIRDSGEVEEGMIPQDEDGPIPQDKRTASPGIRTAKESDGEVKANADGCT